MKKILKQKKFLFPLIFFGELALFITIANIFSLETNNSPYSIFSAYVIYSTLIWFLLRIIKDHKAKLSAIMLPFFGMFGMSAVGGLYSLIAGIVIAMIFLTLMVLFGW